MFPTHPLAIRTSVFSVLFGLAVTARADFQTTDAAQLVLGQNRVTSSGADAANKYTDANGLWNPGGITACGNWMFVSDRYNSRVLGYFKEGSSYAKTAELVLGQPNFTTNGYDAPPPVTDKTMRQPQGIYCDGANLFVADKNDHRVLIFRGASTYARATAGKSADIVLGQTTFETSTYGGTRKGMKYPSAVSRAGDKVFVADESNHRVLIFSTTTIFGDSDGKDISPSVILGTEGTAGTTSSQFKYPSYVFSNGTRLFVSDSYNHRILYWSSIPTVDDTPANAVLGQNDFTTGDFASIVNGYNFRYPGAISYVNNQLIVSDDGHYRILAYDIPDLSVFDSAASFWSGTPKPDVHVIGQASESGATTFPRTRRLYWPSGVFSPAGSLGTYYISDRLNNRVVKHTGETDFSEVWGQEGLTRNSANRGPRPEGLFNPSGLAVGSGKIFIADTTNHRALVFNTPSPITGAAADSVLGQSSLTSLEYDPEAEINSQILHSPTSISIDQSRLYISDTDNNRVLYWNLSNPSFSTNRPADGVIGQPDTHNHSSLADALYGPTSAYSDGKRLFVTDRLHHRVLVWKIDDPGFGQVNNAIILGQPDASSVRQGSSSTEMNAPRSAYSDGVQLFVADTDNNRILVWNDVEKLSDPTTGRAYPADYVLGQTGFGIHNSCTDANDNPVTAEVPCLSSPLAVTSDGKRLFVGHYSYVPGGQASYGRVLEWDLPIWKNNQNPTQKLWVGNTATASTLAYNIKQIQLVDNSIWIADENSHRVVKFADPRSTYVDISVTTRTIAEAASQTDVINALDLTVTSASRNAVNRTINWDSLSVRQEGGSIGDIKEALLCDADDVDNCGNSPLATLDPTAIPGLFKVAYTATASPGKKYILAYRLSSTAKVGNSVGVSLQVNNAYFGFKDAGDFSTAYVKNIISPSRTSGLTTVLDKSDTLSLVAGSPKDISPALIPQNTDVPFLEFQLKSNIDQVTLKSILLRKQGTASAEHIGAKIWAEGSTSGWSGDETLIGSISHFTAERVTVNVSRTIGIDAQKFYVTLSAYSSSSGTVGVKVSTDSNPFAVDSPDIVEPPMAAFASAERNIVSHGPNQLMATYVNKVAEMATVDQGARVLLAKATFWTDRNWTDISEWTITQIGGADPSDIAVAELWKDVNGNDAIDPGIDSLIEGTRVPSTKDFRFTFSGTRISTTPSNFLVSYRTAPNAHVGEFVTLGAFLKNETMKGDANTTPQAIALNTNKAILTASSDIVTVASFPESTDLGQGDEKRLIRKFQLSTDKNTALWQALTVHQQGTADVVEDVKNVYLMKETIGAKETVATGVLDAIKKTWTLTFSDQILSPSPETYYLAVDIGHLAVAGRTVVLNVLSTASIVLDGATDSVSSLGFPHISDTADINQAFSTMTVTGESLSFEPLEKEVGADDIDIASYRTSVDKASVQCQKISILLSGRGAEPSDIDKLELFVGDLFFSSATPRSGTNYFDFTLGDGFRIIYGTPITFTLRASLSLTAIPGDELSFTLAKSGLTVLSPANAEVGNSGGSFKTLPVRVIEPAANLTVTQWTPLAPPEVSQTARYVEMATFTIQMSRYTGQWTQLKINRSDDADFVGSDLSTILLYRDDNKSGHRENTDTLLASGNFGANVSVPAELSLNPTEILNTENKSYILVVHVAGDAVDGHTVGLKIGAASNFVLQSPDSADFPPATNYSTGLSAIKATSDALFIKRTGDDVAPFTLAQGTGPVAFLAIAMAARSNEVTLKGFDIQKFGTLDDRYIENVQLVEDTDLNGTPDKVWSDGIHRFSGNRVTLAFDGRDNVLVPIGASPDIMTRRYFVSLTFSPIAPPNSTIQLKLDKTIVQSPDTVENAEALGVANEDVRTIIDRPDVVSPRLQDIPQLVLAGSVDQGASNAAVLLLRMNTNEDRALWSKLSADLQIISTPGHPDPLVPIDFSRFALFRDNNNNAILDLDESVSPLSIGTMVGQSISFPLSEEPLTSDGPGYFLAVSLAEGATAGESFKLILRNPGPTSIEPVDTLNWPTAPVTLESPTLTVRNVTAPTKPVIADYDDPGFAKQDFLHGIYTPPDLFGRGQFWSSAIQMPFSWGSQMAEGRGDIKSAEYCLGTTAGTCNTHPWTSFTPQPGVYLAKGLNLAHGTTYFISVRATSERYSRLSEVGISNGILIDLDRPQRPIMNDPFIEPTGYSLLWQTVPPTLSGMTGYILEERSESSPAWKSVAASRPGLLRPELTTDGTSLTLVNKNPGSYYYRVVAVNGVGTRSEPSAVVRVDFALASLPSFISQASNYPNPFDTKTGPTQITYTLKSDSDVQLRLYDGFGRQVREERFSAGAPGGTAGGNTIDWNGNDASGQALPQGSYVIRLNAGGEDIRWKIGVWR